MPKVVVVKGRVPERMVEKGLNVLGVNPYKGKAVIKPNLIINRPYPVTTSPKTVERIVNYFTGKTKEIIVAEGSGMCRGGTNKAFLDLGYFELAERNGIKLVDLNDDDYEIRNNPEALKLKEFKFPLTLKNSFLISAAVLKKHSMAKVTPLSLFAFISLFFPQRMRRAFRSTHSVTPLPQLRKINCTLQNALVEKLLKNLRGGLRCATRGWCLKYKSCT